MSARYDQIITNKFKYSDTVKVYKVVAFKEFTDGVAWVPVFGNTYSSIIKNNNGNILVKDTNFLTKHFEGFMYSERQITELKEEEIGFNPYVDDGYISGIHSFLEKDDAFIWAWDNAGMLNITTRILEAEVRKEDLVCGAKLGYDIREIDTCKDADTVISTKIKIFNLDGIYDFVPRQNTSVRALKEALDRHDLGWWENVDLAEFK